MRAVDTNVLVYAFFADSPFHENAHHALADLAGGPLSWAIPWPCIHEFYAVVTNPKIFPGKDLPELARRQVTAWLSAPTLMMLSETPGYWAVLDGLLKGRRVVGPAVHDARIAALCLTNGVRELLTLDRDFSRYPELKVLSIAG